jgi:hypothetical protein
MCVDVPVPQKTVGRSTHGIPYPVTRNLNHLKKMLDDKELFAHDGQERRVEDGERDLGSNDDVTDPATNLPQPTTAPPPLFPNPTQKKLSTRVVKTPWARDVRITNLTRNSRPQSRAV